MPAPTALQRNPEALVDDISTQTEDVLEIQGAMVTA
jgi:hypothetical protein